MHDKQSGKCDVCVKSKITKKTCYHVECQRVNSYQSNLFKTNNV